MTKQELGISLKQIREQKGISTYAMVKEGVRVEVLHKIEKAEGNYTIDSLLAYCKAVGVELNIKEGK